MIMLMMMMMMMMVIHLCCVSATRYVRQVGGGQGAGRRGKPGGSHLHTPAAALPSAALLPAVASGHAALPDYPTSAAAATQTAGHQVCLLLLPWWW